MLYTIALISIAYVYFKLVSKVLRGTD